MNWKSVAIHSLLLLAASVASGILEPQSSSTAPNALLLSYLLTQGALHLVYAGIFAHLAFKSDNNPFAHALLTILLSHEAASVLLASFLSYMRVESSPVQPLPLLAFEYTMLLVALVLGTAAGVHLRRRKQLQSEALSHPAANA